MVSHVLRPGFSDDCTVLPNPFAGVRPDQCPESLKAAVHSRDGHICRACGFASDRFNEVAAITAPAILPADFVTLCRACWLVENMDRAAMYSAAEIIWAPELDQLEINRAMPWIHVQQAATRGAANPAIVQLLESLARRKAEASRKLGHDPKAVLADILSRGGTSTTPAAEIPGKLHEGYRLWPQGRWIERVGQQEFNAYPSMIAHWRRMVKPSERGNYGAGAIAQDWQQRLADDTSPRR